MDKKLMQIRREAIRRKEEWRKVQAKLPFEEKIKRVVNLQKIAINLTSTQRKGKYRVWSI